MSAFEDTLRAFLEYFEKISNSQDEDVFLREFMVSCVALLGGWNASS